MTDAMFSSFQVNDQIQGSYGHLNFKGFGAADAPVVAAETKQDAANNWFQMDQEREDGNNSLYSHCGLYDQQNAMANKLDLLGSNSDQQKTTPPPPPEPHECNWGKIDFQHRDDDGQLQAANAIQPIHEATGGTRKHDDHEPQLISDVGLKPPLKEKGTSRSFTLASLELLSNYATRPGINIKDVNDHVISSCPGNEDSSGPPLSLGEIVRIAGERYIEFSTQQADGVSASIHPYSSALWDLSIEDTANVELVQLLLAAAEAVGLRQFDIASALLTRCRWVASDSGNAVQRIAFYFAAALRERIDIETGRTTLERLNERANYAKRLQVDFNVSFFECHQNLPFSQVNQFAAMQSIVENVLAANKVHLIDLHIRSGIHWTVLMQALAELDNPPTIKISAIGTTNTPQIEEAGKRLQSFAESLNLTFSFNLISVSDMTQLKEDMFSKQADEVVAVYSHTFLRTMIARPDSLRNLMRVIRRFRPAVMVIVEVEANHNSPIFVTRFTESLFYYSAFFDSFEDCMERDSEHRKIIEEIYFGEGIRNMVGTEGDKRCTRNVKMDVWREYFASLGMVEMELSEASLLHAKMVLNKFPKASACTFTSSGKGWVIGWKGTPIHSLTTWKFL